MAEYCISCCSTADLTKEYFDKRGIRYVCFHYELGGTDYLDDLGQTMPPAELYRRGSEHSLSHILRRERISFI